MNEWIPKSQGCWETEAMVTRQLLARSSIWGRDEATAAGSGRVAWTGRVKGMALWDRSLWWRGFWQLVGCMMGCRCSSLGPPVAQPWAFKTNMHRGHAFWEQGEKVLMPEVGVKVAGSCSMANWEKNDRSFRSLPTLVAWKTTLIQKLEKNLKTQTNKIIFSKVP